MAIPHVVAACDDDIVYSTPVGGAWTRTTLASTGFNADPEIAIDGNRLYVAYSHAPLIGCGDTEGKPGVYYRTRAVGGGNWSAATFFGHVMDRLQTFRVAGRKLHATVETKQGTIAYETNASGVLRRYALPGGVGWASLRIGSDGRARIAYEAASSLRYATFTGTRFDWSTIPGTTQRDALPQLVLDAADHAHVVWQHTDRATGGCVDVENPSPVDGGYYATNASGSWTPAAQRRFTVNVGPSSLTVDTKSGRVHVLVATRKGVKYYTKTRAGTWSGVTISTVRASSPTIRLDQPRGRLFAVFANGKVYALTKP